MNRNSRILIALGDDSNQVRHGKEHLMHKHVEAYQDHEHVIYDRRDRVAEVIANPPAVWSAHANQKGGLFDIINYEVNELAKVRDSGNHAQIVDGLAKVAAAAKVALEKMTCD